MLNAKILGSGKAVGSTVMKNDELEKEMSLPKGWMEKASGVQSRYYIDPDKNESALTLGVAAAKQAIEESGLALEDIDCIIGANRSPLQAIPCAASLYQRELGLEESGIPCFDVDTTCYSFPLALFVASNLINNAVYKHILIISSDTPSKTLDQSEKEVRTIFGDGAAAFVVTSSNGDSRINKFLLKTYSSGADFTCVKGGGTLRPPNDPETTLNDNRFQMEGRKVYKAAVRYLPSFLEDFFLNSISKEEYKFIIPHQTSRKGITIFEKFGFKREQIGDHLATHGNCIAASIPMLFHDLLSSRKIDRGDNILLFGTSAGLSLGALSLTY
ncbi:3-oxoacyl-[acyl-carrier-protein] synthase III C-terminal domain-containing protein [Shouchella tritolerans]|uniref:3-oxoacyl-[acyl-carrier-protein] synthase III C-terminal domain-containing protein n=1 Tax=Shouchella tritolerans TaxID=2979466 RepID=UPI0021E8AD12|nr:3-oxoacyl-[acyl-carrier-protein] synthase III C-terminal domain-containing protein [Shouchella tritolerans]